MFARRFTFACAATAVAMAGCSASEGESADADKTKPSTSASSDRHVPTHDADFTADQLDIYHEALQRYTAYVEASSPIWTSGHATRQSEHVFQEYFVDWRPVQDKLRRLEASGITFDGPATNAWSRPVRVASETVTIEQCVVEDGVARKYGIELPPAAPDRPYLVSIVLRRTSEDEEFKIEAATPSETSCKPTP